MVDETPDAGGERAERPARKRLKQAWQPGQSGNPAGRPPGKRVALAAALDKFAEEHAPEILQEAVRLAKAGDSAVLRLIMERVWPPRKGRPIRLVLPNMAEPDGALQALDRITDAMAAGEISAEEAEAAASVVSTRIRAQELRSLEQQLRDLEKQVLER